MSKMASALAKLQDYREQQHAEGVSDHYVSMDQESETGNNKWHFSKQRFVYLFVFIVLGIFMIPTLIANSRAAAELSRTQMKSIWLAENLEKQESRVNNLESIITSLQSDRAAGEKLLSNEMKNLKAAFKNREKDLSEIAIDYNILHVLVNELTMTNQELVNKFIRLHNELEQVKKLKQEAGPQDISLRDVLN